MMYDMILKTMVSGLEQIALQQMFFTGFAAWGTNILYVIPDVIDRVTMQQSKPNGPISTKENGEKTHFFR